MADTPVTTFGELEPDGKLVNVRTLKASSIQACPHLILIADHYREDETCRCDDPLHTEMEDWGYVWNGTRWEA